VWVPEDNWSAVSSFTQPVPPPDTEPDAAPLVCFQLNQSWLPYLVGAAMQLAQPAAWAASDPTALQTVLDRATRLVEMIGDATGCAEMQFRLTSGCVLQFSTDGGTTWTDVTGWPENAPGCYTGATGPPGEDGPPGEQGPPGTWTPGTPYVPPGTSTDQAACNLAAYLATAVLKASLQQAVSSVEATDSLFTFGTLLLGILAGPDPIIDLVLAAANSLFGAVGSGIIGDYTAALADASLWSTVTCAIYGAIKSAGAVNSTTYAAVESALAGISYAHSDVITAIARYWTALTLTGVEQLQLSGVLFVGDCTTCSAGAVGVRVTQPGPAYLQSATPIQPGQDFAMVGWVDGLLSAYGVQYVCITGYDGTHSNQVSVSLGGGSHPIQGYNIGNSCTSGPVSGTNPTGGKHVCGFLITAGSMYVYYGGAVAAHGAACADPLYGSLPYATTWGIAEPGNQGQGELDFFNWACWSGTVPSNADIAAWEAAGPSAPPPGSPVHAWPMSEGSGSTCHDTVGGNDLSLEGGAAWVTL